MCNARFVKTNFICFILIFLLPQLSFAGSHSLSSSELISIEDLQRFIELNRKSLKKETKAADKNNKAEEKTPQISPTATNSEKIEEEIESNSQDETLVSQKNENIFRSNSRALYLSAFGQMIDYSAGEVNGLGLAFGFRDYAVFLRDLERDRGVIGYDFQFSYSKPSSKKKSGGDKDAESYEVDAEIYIPLLSNFYSGLGYKFDYLKDGPGQYSNGDISNSVNTSIVHLPIGYSFKTSDGSLFRFQYDRVLFGTGKIYVTERPFDYHSDATVNLNHGSGFKLAYVNSTGDWELHASYFKLDASNAVTVPYGSSSLRRWNITEQEQLKLGLKITY